MVPRFSAIKNNSIKFRPLLFRYTHLPLRTLPVHAGVVGKELRQSAVGERVLQQPLDRRERAGGDIGPRIETLDDVVRMTDRRGEHLRAEAVGAVDPHDVGHQPDAVLRNVVQASDEGRGVGRTRLGCEQRLPDGEDQRAVGPNAPLGKILHGADTVGRAGELDDDLRMERRQFSALADHAVEIRCDHLGAHVALDQVADLDIVAAAGLLAADVLLGHERRVGRHTVEHAHFTRLANLGQIRRVQKEFHVSSRVWFLKDTKKVRPRNAEPHKNLARRHPAQTGAPEVRRGTSRCGPC